MMKGQKGITLVALIITIIVMLILVGVSISVALNGDLFGKANTGVTKTKEEQVKEAIALAKADILSKYYDPTDTEGKTAPDSVIDKVNKYLPTTLQVTAPTENPKVTTEAGTTYNIEAPAGVDLTGLKMEFNFWTE